MSELVSIVTPLYNSSRFMDATVSSILRQSHSHWELFLVDDGSEDDSASKAQKYSEQDPRIHFIQSEHAGQQRARNLGMAASSTESKWIRFLDHDDLLTEYCLELQLDLAATENAQVVFGGIELFHDADEAVALQNMKSLAKPKELPAYQLPPNILEANDLSRATPNETLYNKELLQAVGGFTETLKTGEELNLHAKIYLAAPQTKTLVHSEPPVVFKRLLDDSYAVQLKSTSKTVANWGLLSRIDAAQRAIASQIQIDSVLQKYLFDEMYLQACYAWRNKQTEHALTALELWQKANIPLPKIAPNWHALLHKTMGFIKAEQLLEKGRKIKNRRPTALAAVL